MKTVTRDELASEITPKLEAESGNGSVAAGQSLADQAEVTARLLDKAFSAILQHLKDGHKVELENFLALSVSKPRSAELREDADDQFFAFAPVSGTLKAEPIGSFAKTLQLGRRATLYYLTNNQDRFSEVLVHHFRKRGWNVVVDNNPGSVLARVDEEVPYAILTESAVDGWQDLVRGIKCNGETNGVPILVIEPSDHADAPVEALVVRHDETIVEPFDVLDVLEKMEDRLATRVATIDEEILTLSMILPGHPSFRRHTCSLVTETLTRAMIAPEFARSAALALNEILVNAVQHGHGDNVQKTIAVRVMLDPRRLLVTVRDQGEGFPHTKVMADARTKKNDPEAQSGLSRVLRAIDRIDYNKAGNEVVLTKFR